MLNFYTPIYSIQQRQTNKELPGPDTTQLGGKREKHVLKSFNGIERHLNSNFILLYKWPLKIVSHKTL